MASTDNKENKALVYSSLSLPESKTDKQAKEEIKERNRYFFQQEEMRVFKM